MCYTVKLMTVWSCLCWKGFIKTTSSAKCLIVLLLFVLWCLYKKHGLIFFFFPSIPLKESLPPVQFDWSSSGLTNPLDGTFHNIDICCIGRRRFLSSSDGVLCEPHSQTLRCLEWACEEAFISHKQGLRLKVWELQVERMLYSLSQPSLFLTS